MLELNSPCDAWKLRTFKTTPTTGLDGHSIATITNNGSNKMRVTTFLAHGLSSGTVTLSGTNGYNVTGSIGSPTTFTFDLPFNSFTGGSSGGRWD